MTGPFIDGAPRTGHFSLFCHPQPDVMYECGQLSLKWALLNAQGRGGYAGIRVGEAQNPGHATHERDWTMTEQPGTHRRINEAGDSVPSSQDSVTRAVQNLHISGSPAASVAPPAPPPPTMENSRRRGRNNIPGNTFAVRSAAQLPTPTGRLLMDVSRSTRRRTTADCRWNWTYIALNPRSSGIGTHPTSSECAEAARTAWAGGRCKLAWSAMREQGRSKTDIASLPHVKLSPMIAPGLTGDRREHPDAIVSFAGAG